MAGLFPILANLFLTASTGKMQTISGTQFCGQRLKLDLAKSLDENGACVESKESNRQKTALHGAAIYGHVSTVQLLLEKGASIEARECSDRTALYFAAKNGHEVTDCSIKVLILRVSLITVTGMRTSMRVQCTH